MSKRETSRPEAIFAGGMIGLWLSLAALGVHRVVKSFGEGEPPWLGIMILVLAAFWISRNAIKIIDYGKQ